MLFYINIISFIVYFPSVSNFKQDPYKLLLNKQSQTNKHLQMWRDSDFMETIMFYKNYYFIENIIDILYQSRHLLHRFFQFEPTTKTPPLSEILEPMI